VILQICVAPTASEAYETRCSLNFGARARTITNKERVTLNVEVDYRLIAKKMSKRIDQLGKFLLETKVIFTYSFLQMHHKTNF